MSKRKEGEPKCKIDDIGIRSSVSRDGHTCYTRLVLPKDLVPSILREYWDSPIHQAQVELLGKILCGEFEVNLR